MVKVAVAGGTGGIGRHIVEGILATKKHSVIVLSRSSSNAILESLGAQVIAVDYNDHASLVAALQGVHTVISAIWANEGMYAAVQISLLNAAVEVGVKRFAPSEWAVASLPDEPTTFYKPKAVVAAAVANSGLEWTIFQTGVFMNYFVSGTEGIGYLSPLKVIVDVENGTATVPGTGNDRVGFTRGEDVGAFVAESLSLEKWPEISGMVGEFVSYNTVIALAEKIRGKCAIYMMWSSLNSQGA